MILPEIRWAGYRYDFTTMYHSLYIAASRFHIRIYKLHCWLIIQSIIGGLRMRSYLYSKYTQKVLKKPGLSINISMIAQVSGGARVPGGFAINNTIMNLYRLSGTEDILLTG